MEKDKQGLYFLEAISYANAYDLENKKKVIRGESVFV